MQHVQKGDVNTDSEDEESQPNLQQLEDKIKLLERQVRVLKGQTEVAAALKESVERLSLSDDGVPSNYKKGVLAPLTDLDKEPTQEEKDDIDDLKRQLRDFEKVKQEVTNLRRIKLNLGEVKKLFGGSVRSLIPHQLNESALARYGTLFDGYFRSVCGDVMMPRDVTKLISFYYPLFWTLETKPTASNVSFSVL